jgi:hypothetical protein
MVVRTIHCRRLQVAHAALGYLFRHNVVHVCDYPQVPERRCPVMEVFATGTTTLHGAQQRHADAGSSGEIIKGYTSAITVYRRELAFARCHGATVGSLIKDELLLFIINCKFCL